MVFSYSKALFIPLPMSEEKKLKKKLFFRMFGIRFINANPLFLRGRPNYEAFRVKNERRGRIGRPFPWDLFCFDRTF